MLLTVNRQAAKKIGFHFTANLSRN